VLDDHPGIKLLLEFWPSGLKQAGVSAERLLLFSGPLFSLFLQGKDGLVECVCPVSSLSDALNYLNLFAQTAAGQDGVNVASVAD
jgi:hypothetical protein